jgi:hypothetical protein
MSEARSFIASISIQMGFVDAADARRVATNV